MRVLTDTQQNLLGFVDACNRGGYRPEVDDVQRWLDTPSPRRMQGMPALSATIKMANIARRSLYLLPGSGEIDHAVELGWLHLGRGLLVTQLGRALLTSAESFDQDGNFGVIELGKSDPLAYPRMVGKFAELGTGILVDPYLRVDELHSLVQQTRLTRFLIRTRGTKASAGDVSAIATYLAGVSRPITVGVTESRDLHDRYVASETEVYAIGTSLNAVRAGTSSTWLFPFPPGPVTDLQRARIEEWWSGASPVEPATGPVAAPSIGP